MSIADCNRRVLNFFSLTLLLSWSFWAAAIALPDLKRPLLILGSYGPAMAAILLLLRSSEGLGPTMRRLLIWRMPFRVYAYAFGLTFAGCLSALWLARMINGSGAILPEAMPVYAPVLVFLYVLVFSVAGEELGWRGYALPRLLAAYGPIRASIVVGVIWAVWHAPLFFMPSDFHTDIPMSLFMVQVVASSLIYTHLHLISNGSLVIAHFFHAAFNTTVGLMPILPIARDGDTTAFGIAVGLLTLVALVTAVRLRRLSP